MAEPVLVIHGVANRNLTEFQELVRDLQQRIGGRFELIPVFWGDHGAINLGITDTIPNPLQASETRGDPWEPDPALIAELVADEEAPETRSADVKAALIAEAVLQGSGGAERVRGENDIAKTIRAELPQTTYLRLVESPRVLQAVGKSIAAGLLSASEDDRSGGRVTRGGSSADQGLIRRLLHGADQLAGTVLGVAFGTFNHYLRTKLVPNLTEALGDVFVYEHLRMEVQKIIWDAVDGNQTAHGYGTVDRPIHVVAHSLGGVITFQTATSSQGRRLYIDGFVTFGSQAPFFHVLDPKGSALAAYKPGTRVEILDSIRKWTNLWEPLDPLAFIASKVFMIGPATSPTSPVDTPTQHLASSGLWTHASYWSSEDLVKAIHSTLGQ